MGQYTNYVIHGTMKIFLDLLKQIHGEQGPSVVLDVGSRNAFEAGLISMTFPRARIISFEPNPAGFVACKEWAKDWPMIELHQVACSDYEGTADFYVVGHNDGGSSLLEPIDVPYSDNTHTKTTVQVRRLDNILRELGVERVDAVWMDIQGVELQALKGMGDYLKDVRVLHAEASPLAYYRGQGLKDELEQFLANQGYRQQFYPAHGHPYGEGDIICVK